MALFIKKECLLKLLKFMAQPFVTLRQEWLKNVVRISIEYLKSWKAWVINLLHPNIIMYILHTVLYISE